MLIDPNGFINEKPKLTATLVDQMEMKKVLELLQANRLKNAMVREKGIRKTKF